MPEEAIRCLLYADTVAVHLALALVLGSLASGLWLASDSSGWAAAMRQQAGRVRRVGIGLGFAALTAMWWLQAASMSEGSDGAIGTAVWRLLTGTHFGRAGIVGLTGWALVAVATWSAGKDGAQRRRRPLAAVGLTAFVWSRSVVSHAGAQGDWSRQVAVDWLHLVLVSAWVGIVLVAAAMALPPRASLRADGLAAARWVARLSSTATVALVGIALTGALKTWTRVPSMNALWPSEYGLRLVVKLALVLLAAVLGGYNRWVVLPPLLRDLKAEESHASRASGPWRSHLVNALRLEAVLLFLVLIAAAVLSDTEAPDLVATIAR